MVECDKFPYLNKVDWLVHNLKKYMVNVGLEKEWYEVIKWLGDGGWDMMLLHEVNGRKLIDVLIDECIDDPYTRDEEEWEGYMECVVEKLEPVIKAIAPHFEDLDKKLKEALKEMVGNA